MTPFAQLEKSAWDLPQPITDTINRTVITPASNGVKAVGNAAKSVAEALRPPRPAAPPQPEPVKSAYRGRAFAHGAVDAFDALRQMLTRRGGGAVKAMHGFADKIPGRKAVGKMIYDPEIMSEDKWRAVGAGATGGAVGGTVGVGISKALRELGIYKNLGIEKEDGTPYWKADVTPLHMRDQEKVASSLTHEEVRRRRKNLKLGLGGLGGGVVGAMAGLSSAAPTSIEELRNNDKSPLIRALVGALIGGTGGVGLAAAGNAITDYADIDPILPTIANESRERRSA